MDSCLLRSVAGVLFLLASIDSAHADCECRCVNGKMRPVCESAMDMPPLCMDLCPLPPADLPPLPPMQLPPLGTSHCSYKQVWDSNAGAYVWKQVCE
jgi:hypothetical protein